MQWRHCLRFRRALLELINIKTVQWTLADVDENEGASLSDAYLIQSYITRGGDVPKNSKGYSLGEEILIDSEPDPVPEDPDLASDTDVTDSEVEDTDTEEQPITDTDTSQTDSEPRDTDWQADVQTDFVHDTDELPPVIPVPDSELEEPPLPPLDSDELPPPPEPESDSDVIVTDVDDTDSAEPQTDSEEPVVVRPLDEIVYDLDGGFERAAMGDAWILGNGVKASDCVIESGAGTNGSKGLKLTSKNESIVFAVNRLSGLKPESTYKLTAKVRGNLTVNDEHHNGIFVQVGGTHSGWAVNRNEDGTYNYGEGAIFYSYNNWIQSDCGETTITVYFESTNRGLADVECLLYGTGTAYYDDLTLTEVDYNSEPVDKVRVVSENIGLVLEQKDVEGISREQLQAWCDDVEWGYGVMYDLMGETPFGGTRLYLISTYEPYMKSYQALSGINPIKWRSDYMSTACRRFCEEDIISDVAYHEVAHLFDRLSYRWHFDTEFGAEYKKLYVLLQKGEGEFLNHGWGDRLSWDGLAEYTKSVSANGYEKSIVPRTGKRHYDGLNYIMYRTTEIVGWDTVRSVFHDYCTYYDPRFNSFRGRFDYLMMCLQNKYNATHSDATGFEIIDSFPGDEFEYIQSLVGNPNGESERVYRVQFLDPDGERLYFRFVPSGDAASVPDPAASDKYGRFTGWDADISSVTSDMTVTAQYENFSYYGTVDVTTGSDKVYEGEFASITAAAPDSGCQFNIICTKGSDVVYESGYSSSSAAKVFIGGTGSYTVYAKVKDSGGAEHVTKKAQFTAEKAAVIYYSGFNEPNIHYKAGSGSWTAVPGVKMTKNSDVSGYAYKYVIPLTASASTATLCFNDGNNNWDNNGEKDYTVNEGATGIKNGTVTVIK